MRPVVFVSRLCIIAAISAPSAFGNGINPPRPRESVLVKAVCEARADGPSVELWRARIQEGDRFKDSITVRRDGVVSEIGLRSIYSMQILQGNADAQGFTPVALVTAKDTPATPAFAKTRDGRTEVLLVGFSGTAGDSARSSVELSRCSKIGFGDLSAAAEGSSTGRIR